MRGGMFIGILLCILLAVGSFLAGCKSENENTLEGVWERVEARFTTAGITESDNQKVIKMYTKNHWVIIGQEPNRQNFTGEGTDAELLNAAKTFGMEAGTYTIKDNVLTEYVEYAFIPNWVGVTVSFNIKWEGDKWIQTGTFPNKALGMGENDTDSYEVWKRIE